eukprot:9361812-Alexandrium_andersonii.AAC.1
MCIRDSRRRVRVASRSLTMSGRSGLELWTPAPGTCGRVLRAVDLCPGASPSGRGRPRSSVN